MAKSRSHRRSPRKPSVDTSMVNRRFTPTLTNFDEMSPDEANVSPQDSNNESQKTEMKSETTEEDSVANEKIEVVTEKKNTTLPRKPTGHTRSVAKVKHGSAYFKTLKLLRVNEDLELQLDPEGETKIDSHGNLLGGREFKIRHFTLPRNPKKLYMLAGDVSKALQFRDTYVLYLKTPELARIMATAEDKEYMQEHNILSGILKKRSVSLTTARSLFREFGHKCIKKGKVIVDDYWVSDSSKIINLKPPSPIREAETRDKGSSSDEGSKSSQKDSEKEGSSAGGKDSDSTLFVRVSIGPSIKYKDRHSLELLSARYSKKFRAVISSLLFNKKMIESRRESCIDTRTKQFHHGIKPIYRLKHFQEEPKEDRNPHELKVPKLEFDSTYPDISMRHLVKYFQTKVFGDDIPPNENFLIAIMPNQYQST